jgi:hypothetical protein
MIQAEKNGELRSEIRKAAEQGAVVEFRPSAEAMVYQMTLRNWSDLGLGLLVKKNSGICKVLEKGHTFAMAVHKVGARDRIENVRVEVRHISEPAAGQHPDHYIIGLLIRERMEG